MNTDTTKKVQAAEVTFADDAVFSASRRRT